MSDGITDSYRDERRAKRYEDFLDVLALYIENQTPENFNELKSAAKAVDDVPRGLISGPTKLAEGLDDMVGKLIERDKKTWGKLLLGSMGLYPKNTYKKLKNLSPFAGQLLIGVDYGLRFVTLDGEELQEFLDHLIGNRKNLKIYDADKYLVTLPESIIERAEVTWLRCGIYGIKEPRKNRK